MEYDDRNRPPLGARFRILLSEDTRSSYSRDANKFAGQIGSVGAYKNGVGVFADFVAPPEYPVIPYEQCEWQTTG